MKIIFSQAFLSDVTRKDTTLIITRYFLGKTIIEKWFDNWDELTSDDFVLGFNSNQRTTERKVEGLWESDNKQLKIHIKIDEAEAYNINNSLMGYNIGFFYYKNAYSDESIAWILLPDEISLDPYTPGRFGFSEYTSLDLILGSNMVNIPTEMIPGINCRLECEGETEETKFLEGHGVFRGVDPWKFPESSEDLIFSSSVKDYIIGGKGKEFVGASVFLSPEGTIGENPFTVKIPEEVKLEVANPGSPTPMVYSVTGLGGILYLKGSWTWKRYKITSSRWEYIDSGEDLTLETLPLGRIITQEIAGTEVVGKIEWKNKSIEILPFALSNGTRQANISIEVPKLFPDGSIISIRSSQPVMVIQNTSTAAWEVDFPGTSKTSSGSPLLELTNGVEKSIIARTNQDFIIVTQKGQEPQEGGWVRLDPPEESIDPEALMFTMNKIPHGDLWWELKITFISNNYLPIDPLKYTLWMGNEPYEFYVLPGDAMLLRTKVAIASIPTQVPTFSVSGSNILEVNELEISSGVDEFQIFLQSSLSEDLEATILPPKEKVGDMVFASSFSHRIIIPAKLPNLNSGVWIPVKVLGSGEEITEVEKWRISIKPKEKAEEKTIDILIKEGKNTTSSIPNPPVSSNLLHFHALGTCLEGWKKKGLGTVLDEVPEIQKPELTYLLMWTKEDGYTQVEDFSCFNKSDVTQLLSRLSINSEEKIKAGTLILKEWGKEENLWITSFVQGYITGNIDPEEIQLSGPKNSIFPVVSEVEVKGIEQEPTPKGKKKDARKIITSPELSDVEWLEGSEKLELEGRRIEWKDNKFFPVFNVSPKYYSEEFKIHVRLKIKITLDPGYREMYGVKDTSIVLPIDFWINKPKL